MSDEHALSNEALVAGARAGDQAAWEQIVRRYEKLIDRICRRYRLDDADAADVRQHVWIRLIEYADRLHTPAALPGWIATTATRACLAVTNHRRRQLTVDSIDCWSSGQQRAVGVVSEAGYDDVSDSLLRAEQCRAVQLGLAELTSRQRDLLLLLVADPPIPYRQISRQTGIPVGSIGPTRSRLLNRLAQSRALRRLTEPQPATVSCVA